MDDQQLLQALRGGDMGAYEELWARNHRAAMTLARKLLPRHAEHLVSESFTSVLQAVTVSGKGQLAPVDPAQLDLLAAPG